MDPLIKKLKSTTFFGRRFTRKQIADIQQTVATFPALSRKELAQTICEHLHWRTPSGSNRVAAALGLLEELAQAGIFQLPPKRVESMRPGPRQPPPPTRRSDPQPLIETGLRELEPLRLLCVEQGEDVQLFNEYIERHHYLGYRQPRGPHLRYFLLDRQGRRLGCLLFSQATRSLACRDEWIGWPRDQYRKHLDLVVSQPRFLVLPWVRVKCLASKALSLALRQLPQDWQQRYRTQPVLVETFVDAQRFRGTCYRAANWQCIGQTRGRADAGRTRKDVYVYPLARDFRSILLHGPRRQARQPPPALTPEVPDTDFIAMWQDLIGALGALAAAHDRQWQQRSRVLNTLLVMLFVFRLVFAPRRQGYTTTLAQLWTQCRALDVPLPQPQPVSDAAMCKARPRIHEQVFKQFHAEILGRADVSATRWHGHRVFAVDGSKLNLPRQLAAAGYRTPGPHAHYPQGLLSCLLRLQSRIPVDFDLWAHADERAAARVHLDVLAAPDLVVYDRGYYSFELLWAHRQRGLQAVFRLPRKICPVIDSFIDSDRTDELIRILPGRDTLRELSRKYPGTHWQPLPLRLVKYTHATTEYLLGTTLLDSRRYSVADLSNLYHARWGIEEMYKISKQFLEVQQFHGQSERLVKQELYAHFNLIAMGRLFTNRDADGCRAAQPADGKPLPQANFKHSLAALAQHLEGLLLRHSAYVSETLERICEWVGTGRRKPRRDRSYPRRSLQPAPKWSRRKAKQTAAKLAPSAEAQPAPTS